MTKNISRKMAVDCLLWRFKQNYGLWQDDNTDGFLLNCICGTPIKPGQDIQFDHIHADVFDGPHEYQNLRPVHAECHKIKTKADVQANSKIKRILANKPSRRPMAKSGRKIQSRPFPKRLATSR